MKIPILPGSTGRPFGVKFGKARLFDFDPHTTIRKTPHYAKPRACALRHGLEALNAQDTHGIKAVGQAYSAGKPRTRRHRQSDWFGQS